MVFTKSPSILKVTRRIEVTVLGAIEWLNLCKIHSDHESLGIFVSDIDSPYSSAAAKIEHSCIGRVRSV
jgi:hypothetical protein